MKHIMHYSRLAAGSDVQQIHIIIDRYKEDSIKSQTCKKGGEGRGHVYNVKGDGVIPEIGTNFSVTENKKND